MKVVSAFEVNIGSRFRFRPYRQATDAECILYDLVNPDGPDDRLIVKEVGAPVETLFNPYAQVEIEF